jgi:hypothetical protein
MQLPWGEAAKAVHFPAYMDPVVLVEVEQAAAGAVEPT